jgi:hypothetical protein
VCIYFPIFSHNLPPKNFSRHLSTNLISFQISEIFYIALISFGNSNCRNVCLSREITLISTIWISVLSTSEVSKGMTLVDKCLEKCLICILGAHCVRKWGNRCRTACTFLCGYTTFSSIGIVALLSVNKFHLES